MTAVGKIFKPTLRQDAVERAVRAVLDEQGLTGEIEVTAGGPRGMKVAVTLAAGGDPDVARLQDVLDGYLFQATVTT